MYIEFVVVGTASDCKRDGCGVHSHLGKISHSKKEKRDVLFPYSNLSGERSVMTLGLIEPPPI